MPIISHRLDGRRRQRKSESSTRAECPRSCSRFETAYISEEMQVDEEQLQNVQVEFTIHDAEEEVQEETQEVEYASDNEFISDPPITVKQVKRLYAIAHGDTKLINDIIEEYGYEKLQDIRRGDYEAICNAVQSAVLEQEEQLSDTIEQVEEQ